MRVLQIGATFVGAQKKIEYTIHKHLQEQGHKSSILYAIGESDDPDIICYENKFDSIVRRGLRKVLTKHPCFASLSTIKLIRHIKKYRPELVHIHIIHHGYLNYGMLFKYLAKQKVPVVFTVHDMWCFTGGCYYYSTVGCDGFKSGCHNCPKNDNELDCRKNATAKYFKKKLELFSRLKSVSFVSVSPWVYSQIKTSKLAKYPQYLVMNSVEKVADTAPQCEKRDNFTVIGVAANWDERKGLKRFYELGQTLRGQCDIILVGNVEDSLKENAPDNITFYGYTNSADELYDLYSSCDLHVSMSYEETFGLTFVEAALAGIRSMGFHSTAIPAVLQKTNGYVISSCTVEETATKIRQLIQQRGVCTITGQEYSDISRYFSPQRMALEYQRVYEEMYDSHL